MAIERRHAPRQHAHAADLEQLLRHGRAEATARAAGGDDGCDAHGGEDREAVKQ